MQAIDVANVFNREPEQVVEYLQQKGYTFSWKWQDTLQEAHARAFTVAKAMRLDILQDIRGSLDKAILEGRTFEQFQRDLMPTLKTKGWWGKVMVGDGAGGAEVVQLGSPRRLRTIYDVNLQTANQAGRYKSQWADRENRPYWMYVAILDSKTRPLHRALNGKVFRADDPFWHFFYPPNGWRCRCRVRALSAAEVEALGLTVESSEGNLSFKDVLLDAKTGETIEVAVYQGTDAAGKPFTVSPDAAWSYNPGRAAWQPNLNLYEPQVAAKYVEGGLTGPDYQQFFQGKSAGNFPVAILDEQLQATIGAKGQTVYLSDQALAGNLARHPELLIEDYQQLPDLIARAQLIVQTANRTDGHSLLFVQRGDKNFEATIRADDGHLALTSFRLISEADMKSLKKRGTVLLDET